LGRIYVIDVDQPRALALAMLTDVAGYRRDKETAAEAEYLLGEYHRRTGELGTAIDHFLEAGVLAETDRELIAKSMLRAAELLEQSGRRSEAATLVQRLQEQFAGTDWARRGAELLR
jgi:tetratricopeptide (TPR) repeat protein